MVPTHHPTPDRLWTVRQVANPLAAPVTTLHQQVGEAGLRG